jgi:hypothetical protein
VKRRSISATSIPLSSTTSWRRAAAIISASTRILLRMMATSIGWTT